jgi:hypothetical protein
MEEKLLGKITHSEFGQYPDRPFLFGLQLCFEFKGSGVCDGARYTVNISPECRWERTERYEAIDEMIAHLNKVLVDAKVNYVSQLKGKPVEVTLVNNTFKDFRILTEVI